ncbi:MAG: cadmium-translocating P-type ATPase [Bacteroidales bacterium]
MINEFHYLYLQSLLALILMESKPEASGCCGDNCIEDKMTWKSWLPAIASFLLLAAGVLTDHRPLSVILYAAAYLPVAFPVVKGAWENIRKKNFFNEYTLMFTATAGAFAIREYPEGVAVMLFYSVGELFQKSAVNKARNNIKALLDIRPNKATVFREGAYREVSPEEVNTGETILVKAGEKVPLDGVLLSSAGSFNTSALTGESLPKTLFRGEKALAGMLNIDKVTEIEVEKRYADSSLAKILEMVQEAASRKAKTETLVRKFAKVYTPIVFGLALSIAIIPAFVAAGYVFETWLYRALVFLVISCPCALVVSIPLGYFGGIGAASHNGILFKGANYLDLMASVDTVVMDKTGTLTKGVFNVREIVHASQYDRQTFLHIVSALERRSNHPAAKAIVAADRGDAQSLPAEEAEEIAGCGIKGIVNGREVRAGNARWMRESGIPYDASVDTVPETVVIVAIDRQYAGYIVIADEVKDDAAQAVSEMRKQGVRQTVMLSGDHAAITLKIANMLGIDNACGDLLPEGKVKYIEALKADASKVVAFVGDGINDAPVLALSDVGIAMGGMGSDAAIEVADVVIQTDQPSKIAVAIRIAKATKRIVMQNIALAVGVKLSVLSLGAAGFASMWGAVFADVGVALLAILNAVRILRMKF